MGEDFHKLANWTAGSDEVILQMVLEEPYNKWTPPSWSDLEYEYEIKLYPHKQGLQTIEYVIRELILWLPCYESGWVSEYPHYQPGKKNCLRNPRGEVQVSRDTVKIMQDFFERELDDPSIIQTLQRLSRLL